MKNIFWKRERIEIMTALALFNYVFLGAEYLFDNMMAFQTDSGGVVLAQSYVLGSSTVGFLLFGILDGKLREREKKAGSAGAGVLAAVCLWEIQVHQSYGSILAAGLILYVLLGIAGSLVHYRAACRYGMEEHLAETVGVSYAIGLFLQFLENNLIHNAALEAVILAVAFGVLLFLVEKKKVAGSLMERNLYESDPIRHPYAAAVMLIFTVALMTCIFATLDNAVTLGHAGGSMDIGQWPRLILAVSGLVSGVLFDYGKGRYREPYHVLRDAALHGVYTCDRFRRLFFAWADRVLSVGRLLCCVFLDRFCAVGGVHESATVLGWHGKIGEQSLRHTHWKLFCSTDPVRRQYEDHDRIDWVICTDQHCDLYLHGDGTDGCGIA